MAARFTEQRLRALAAMTTGVPTSPATLASVLGINSRSVAGRHWSWMWRRGFIGLRGQITDYGKEALAKALNKGAS